jgi:hypothetical protein
LLSVWRVQPLVAFVDGAVVGAVRPDPQQHCELDAVRFRTCSAEGEWLNRMVNVELVKGRKPEPNSTTTCSSCNR